MQLGQWRSSIVQMDIKRGKRAAGPGASPSPRQSFACRRLKAPAQQPGTISCPPPRCVADTWQTARKPSRETPQSGPRRADLSKDTPGPIDRCVSGEAPTSGGRVQALPASRKLLSAGAIRPCAAGETEIAPRLPYASARLHESSAKPPPRTA